MSILASLRERRILPFLGSYVVAGFIALEAVDQLVSNDLVPQVLYHITLILYVAGIPATAVFAWFQGAKGDQKMPKAGIWLLSMIGLVAIGASGVLVRNYVHTARMAELNANSELDLRRVAVLYFADPHADQGLGYLADGLTESLIDNLALVREIDVVSKNGVGQFRGSNLPVDSIARVLKAGTIIDGTVVGSGDRIRVSLQLIDGASGADYERTSFEQPADELMAARDSLSAEVARILRGWLGEEIRLRERRAGTADVQAWNLVQRAERERKNAEEHFELGEDEAGFAAFERADTLLAQASECDPAWAEPFVMQAEIAYRRSRYGFAGRPEEVAPDIQRGLALANQALDLDPNSAAAFEHRGTLRYWSWLIHAQPDPVEQAALLTGAQADLEQATQLDPTRASAYCTLSHLYYQTEGVAEVVIAAQRAYEEDAYLDVASEVLWRLSVGTYDLAQFAAAKRWCEVGAERFPDDYRFTFCQLTVLATPAADPDVDRAWNLLGGLGQLSPENRRDFDIHRGRIFVAAVIGRAGMPDSARAVLDRNRASISQEVDPNGELMPIEAYARAQLGDEDEAIDLLKFYSTGEHGFTRGDNLHWWFLELSNHPRWHEVETAGQ